MIREVRLMRKIEKINRYISCSYPNFFDSTQSWQREDAKWLAPRQRWMWHCSRTSTSSSHTDTNIPCPGFFEFLRFHLLQAWYSNIRSCTSPVPLSQDELHHQNCTVTQSQSAISSTVWKGSLTHDFGSCRPGARVEWEKSVAQLGWGCRWVSEWKLWPNPMCILDHQLIIHRVPRWPKEGGDCRTRA